MDTDFEFDYTLKREGFNYIKDLIESVKVYMIAGIKLAHQGKVTKEQFWEGLFIKEGTGWDGFRGEPTNREPLKYPTKKENPENCPEDPYMTLDFQATNKYLYYGGDRVVSWNGTKPVFAQDSYLYFKYFGIKPFYRKDFGKKVPKTDYEQLLDKAIGLRNFSYHENLAAEEEITPASMAEKITLLKGLTKELERKKGWIAQSPLLTDRQFPELKEFWEERDSTYKRLFGAPPMDLEEVLSLLFETAEATEEQRTAMEQALDEYHVVYKNGRIYHQPSRQELLKKLRWAPSVCRLRGLPQEIVEQMPAPEAEPVVRIPIHNTAAGILQRAGALMDLNRDVLKALSEGFTLLVDESVFLADEGRKMLEQKILPFLKDSKTKLFVDESVIATLFRQFRRSVPYTELELSEIEPELRDELQELRRETHRNCKAAIKVVRALRQNRCLEVVASLTDSDYSYENIYQVAERNPQSRFFVLSLDNQLAEELQGVTGKNAVAAKPGKDLRVLVYRASRETYQALLGEQLPAQPEVKQAPAVPERLSLSGSRVVAEWPDGNRQELRLGKSLGWGGEGEIFTTSAADGAVAKIYFRGHLTQARRDKVSHMIQQNPGIPGLCWPQAMVYTANGEWMGFLMPRAEGQELGKAVYHPGRNNSALTKRGWTRKSLALIAANIAAAFAKMHEKGILMGDVNPRNFMVAPDCTVYLVDCDSYQFDGFPCPVGTDLYTAPEVHRQMKAQGKRVFDYTRTIEHEKYSLAVLLFEVLMLGKAPYESRNTNNEDVIQAILAGTFPYPYKGDEEEENSNARSTVMAPVGRWRQIWSHMTYRVKTDFFETFTGKGRRSAAEWENTLREYIRQIDLGHSSDDLVPTGYKDTSDRGGGEMVDLVCTFPTCTAHFNMGKEVYLRRKERGEPDYCPLHQDIQRNFARRMVPQPCGICGTRFEISAKEWREREAAGKPLLCPSCVNETVTCSRCQGRYAEKRDKVQELRSRGKALLCPDCFEIERPTVTCEDCGEQFRSYREKVETLRQQGRQVLCKSCLDKMRAARNKAE